MAHFMLPLIESLLIPAHVRTSRSAWKEVSQRLGLAFSRGLHRKYVQGDRLEGTIAGRHVSAEAGVNWEVQKVVITLAVALNNRAASMRLGGEELAAWYEERRATVPNLPPISQEFLPWAIGQRQGIGTSLENDALVYRQLYGIDDAVTLAFLLEHLASWAEHLEAALPMSPE